MEHTYRRNILENFSYYRCFKKTTAYSTQKHTIKHIQCTYSATDKLLFAMLGLRYTSEIFLLQKKAIRIISGANIKSHTEPIFKLYNLLKMKIFTNLNY